MQTTSIIIPLDASTVSDAVLPYAAAIARATNAPVRLLSVFEQAPDQLGTAPPGVRQRFARQAREQLAWRLQEAGAWLAEHEVETTTDIITGEPVDEILAAADADDGAMIVMATHGRSGLDRWLIGSVADNVMRLATRPTLLIRPEDDPAPMRVVNIKRILVPLDGSDYAEAALEPAGDLATRTGAEVMLVRVEPWTAGVAGLYGYLPNVDELQAGYVKAAQDYLEAQRTKLPEGVNVRTIVLHGSPLTQIAPFARQESVDLTVLSTHGAGGIRRLVMGSTADRLVRAGVPALLVRPAVPQAESGVPAIEPSVRRCATCGRLISFVFDAERRCPRCKTHLVTCTNCVYWDTLACVLQRAEAHDRAWAGHACPRFTFRETPARSALPVKPR
jgi:nucleotide-binding universal stress UspA family protein